MNANTQKPPRNARGRPADTHFDEADWVDWDHWQTVEEIQDFLNGLDDRSERAEDFGPTEDNVRIARQIRRCGLQAEG